MRLVDGSPDLWMYPIEIKFLDHLAPTAGTIPGVELQRWAEYQFGELERNYVAKLQEPLPAQAAHPSPLEARREYPPAMGLKWFLERAAERYGPCGEGVTLGFKSTEAEQKRLYERSVPELLMIHIVREPISQFASTKRTVLERPGFLHWYQRGDLIATFLRRWRAHVETALDGLRREPARHLLVRYEDLRANPGAEIRRIVKWLGIAPPPEPEMQTVLGGRHMTRLPTNPSKAGVETPKQVVADMEKEFDYADVVSRREERLLRHCTAPLSNALGYPESRQSMTTLARVRLLGAWILPERWEIDLVKHRRRALLELFGRRRFVFRALFSYSTS